jgi:DNA (cytosine-5)-methyltransferase 1
MEAYKTNHNPKYAYLEPIQTFKLRTDLPDELYNLDILDGSPPCSSFSMAGNREKDWGKEKKFREGQAKQVLDNLFFDFIDLAKKLQPKVVIAENVKGLLLGNAKQYVRQIYREFDLAGYYCQHWLLDASKMGVPQKRERVFFIAMRKNLALQFLEQQDMFTVNPKLNLDFNETGIPFINVKTNEIDRPFKENTKIVEIFHNRKVGDKDFSCTCGRIYNKPNLLFNYNYIYDDNIANTITAKSHDVVFNSEIPRYYNKKETIALATFPEDYNFGKLQPHYMCGMSVPPVMIAQIAKQVYEQWLKIIK